MDNCNGAGARSGAGNGKHDVEVMDGLGSRSEASRGHRNMPVGAGRHDQVSPEATRTC